MEQDVLVSAIGKQLDGLSSLISTTVGLALIAAWAGLQGEEKVSVFSVTMKRQHAFYILGASFITANATAIIYFLRIADLIAQVSDQNFAKALTILGTHQWPYNPFAYFGDSALSLVYSGFGFGLLIVIWWIGFTALGLLVEYPSRKPAELLVMAAFLAVGLSSMLAINQVFTAVMHRIDASAGGVPIDVRANGLVRAVFTFLGIGAGALLSWVAQISRRNARTAKHPAKAKVRAKGPALRPAGNKKLQK